MPNAFVPLRVFLAPPKPIESEAATEVFSIETEEPAREPVLGAFVREVKLARAALADALDVARCDLLRDLAADVLGRELLLAPADLEVIIARALERAKADLPVAIRVHPEERSLLAAFDVPVLADKQLRRGDIAIVVKSGTIDVSLGARLAAILEPDA